jgi:hypothetical protein
MEKVFKIISNSLLTVFLFGLMLIPIASITIMGVKPQDKNILSAQDKLVIEEVEETTESTKPVLTSPKKINN